MFGILLLTCPGAMLPGRDEHGRCKESRTEGARPRHIAFRDSLQRGGWLDYRTAEEATEMVHDAVMEVLLVADRFPAGTVIGTNLGTQYVRLRAAAR